VGGSILLEKQHEERMRRKDALSSEKASCEWSIAVVYTRSMIRTCTFITTI